MSLLLHTVITSQNNGMCKKVSQCPFQSLVDDKRFLFSVKASHHTTHKNCTWFLEVFYQNFYRKIVWSCNIVREILVEHMNKNKDKAHIYMAKALRCILRVSWSFLLITVKISICFTYDKVCSYPNEVPAPNLCCSVPWIHVKILMMFGINFLRNLSGSVPSIPSMIINKIYQVLGNVHYF